jgi:YesN/AraC family two-component response regulator
VIQVNSAEAWKAFQIALHRFDLLITDRAMPDMTGEMPAHECHRLRPDLPYGITEFILKPLTSQDLAHTIRRVLDVRVVDPPAEDTQSTPTSLSEECDAISTHR